MYRTCGKRVFDIVAASVLLTAASPVLFLLILLVGLWHGRPVFFRQSRPGFAGQPFTILKLRTMDGSPEDLASDAKRLLSVGRFLRSWSLDELPELWNVLRGDMTFVGPRPLLMQYLSRYSPRQYRRHEVKPGITGWAQVNGRNAISWEQKFELDIWYVDHLSFWLDIKILAMTFRQVITRRGINAAGDMMMPEFTGSPPCA